MDFFNSSVEAKNEVLRMYETDQKSLLRDVEIIEEWLKKQPHLPQNFQYDNFIEKVLIRKKCSVERAKDGLENLFTLRTVCRSFFEDLRDNFISASNFGVNHFFIPKLGPQNQRIFYLNFKNGDEFDLMKYIKADIILCELYMKYDYSFGISVIMDFKNFGMDHAKKLSLSDLTRLSRLVSDGYSVKILSMDLINLSQLTTIIMATLKAILKAKIFSRIQIHDSLESLSKKYPSECLPNELGGSAGRIEDLIERTDNIIRSHKPFFAEIVNYRSNEDLRVGKPKYDSQMFGVDGTFKQLSLD